MALFLLSHNEMSALSPSAMRMLQRQPAGFTLVQVMIAAAIIVIVGLASVQALVLMNRKAATMRTLNNARAVVQRNIDTAMGVPFSSTFTPAILAVTTSSGAVYDDDGGGDFLVIIGLLRAGTSAWVKGTLTRTVLAESNADNADIRRVTFNLSYTYRGKAYTFAMTTLRTQD
jgi:type II secretory pathway pseudopilin PulG